jgi:2-keto-4-pentenoate hydratase/2-oxohepta-3-ene-1,7-dioic acid hydratase in catechol pathway
VDSPVRRIPAIAVAGVTVISIGLLVAWWTSPDPRYNPASFEDAPLQMQLLSLDQGITLAQYVDREGSTRTIAVLSHSDDTVTGVDLGVLGATDVADPFEALAQADLSPLSGGAAGQLPTLVLSVSRLLPSGPPGVRHIGTGTNFPEHASEANSGSVFQFPKFGPATAARSEVRAVDGILLDYEVELGVRFDRDLRTIGDFDASVKAFFLCGDFTNRNALVNLADPDDLDSGYGFSDAKSGPDFYPTGPFLVVPNDWSAFVGEVRMTTSVNGEPRQDARGSEMTLDFRQLVEKALGDMADSRFLFRDGFVKLVPDGKVERSSTIMSGTAEGTIFTPPSRGDIIEGAVQYLRRGGPFGEDGFVDVVRKRFIRNELEGGHFLRPGDVVRHGSNHLGDIEVRVVG